MKCKIELRILMKKLALTNYYNFTKKENNDHICPHCSRKIKKWALSQCSSCNRFFCRSHMEPSIGDQKKCPGCRKHQQDFIQSNPVFNVMKTAEHKISEFRLAESEELEHILFASIFGNKEIIITAQENNEPDELEESNSNEQNVDQQVVEQPVVEAPEELKETEVDPSIDIAAETLANKIAESIKGAGITSNTDEAAAQILNYILANTQTGNVKTAQQKIVDQAFKGNPIIDIAETLKMQPEYHPADLAPYGQLSPQEGQLLNNIYNKYISIYGRAFLEFLPATSEANFIENRRRGNIRAMYLNEIKSIIKDPNKIRMFYQKMGINPDLFVNVVR